MDFGLRADLIAIVKDILRHLKKQDVLLISANFFFQKLEDGIALILATSIRVNKHFSGLNGVCGLILVSQPAVKIEMA